MSILHTRKDREAAEESSLAPYAVRSAASRGRRHPEEPHPYRSEFQRDRDRILHSRAFRRLEYKTQVFINGTADHYRTRLTHTIEMAAVGRTIARALKANEDLTEAIALAHDIGHSPFGHSGERALNEIMQNEGGFDHNVQSLRWVELLESSYPGFDGLNLTWEVRAGLRKHQAEVPGAQLDEYPLGPFQFLEAQIADVADDMTYHAHDVDDGLEAGLINDRQLQELELWRLARRRAAERYGDISDARIRLASTVRAILDIQVEDVIKNAVEALTRHQPQSPADVQSCPERIAAFSPHMNEMLVPFRAFLYENVYWHSDVSEANQQALRMMRRLFFHYIENPDHLGRKARSRIEHDGLWRTVCDYVSGMTDRYAVEEYARFGLENNASPPDPSRPSA